MNRAPHVCIVGAGVAGLRCAEVLLENDIDVTILEARDRIGGRVYQNDQLGHSVDLGANWIHGTDKNPIMEIATKTGTVTYSIEEAQSIIDENGKPFDQSKAGELAGLVWGMIADAFKFSNSTSPIPADRSLKGFFVEKLEEKDLSPEEKRVVMQAAEVFGGFVGELIHKQSLKYFWLEECLEGENLFVAGTYQKIFDYIAKTATEKANIKLSTTVTEISSETFSSSKNPYIEVTTSEPTNTHRFDAVILTLPLGALKHQNPIIKPSPTNRISTALRNMTYGRLEKAYITFPTAFWSSSSSHPFFTNFLHPTYDPSNPGSHIMDCVSLSNLPGETAHPTLLFYLHGPPAEKMTSILEPYSSTSSEYQSLLINFLKPYYSLLPNYSPNSLEGTPKMAIATAWQKDEYAGYGSYTNFQVKQDGNLRDEEYKLDEDIVALREGMPERGVWFAGEHTAPFVALGTVTGAWWSGESVGTRVVEWFGKGDRVTEE